MSEIKVKTGGEIVNEFFQNITDIPNVDKEIAQKIKELYNSSRLTETYLKNLLNEIIEQGRI